MVAQMAQWRDDSQGGWGEVGETVTVLTRDHVNWFAGPCRPLDPAMSTSAPRTTIKPATQLLSGQCLCSGDQLDLD